MLTVFTIYNRPRDYPTEFICRRWFISGGCPVAEAKVFARGTTLEEVRDALPPGLTNICREPLDDPAIIESWI